MILNRERTIFTLYVYECVGKFKLWFVEKDFKQTLGIRECHLTHVYSRVCTLEKRF